MASRLVGLISKKYDNRGTHHSMRKMVMFQTIVVDHIATASVCSLLFLGIFAGTNLRH